MMTCQEQVVVILREGRTRIPVWLPSVRCRFSCRAPGVGIDIRLLNSSEHPETSPDCIATEHNTKNHQMSSPRLILHANFETDQLQPRPSTIMGDFEGNGDRIAAPHPDFWPVRGAELNLSRTACPASSGRVCLVWTPFCKRQGLRKMNHHEH